MEARLKAVPIELIFAPHLKRDMQGIRLFEQRLEYHLKKAGKGRVVMAGTEDASMPEKASREITEMTRGGIMPSLARLNTIFRDIGLKQTGAERERLNLINDGSNSSEVYGVLDSLHKQYLGKLVVIPELSPPEILAKVSCRIDPETLEFRSSEPWIDKFIRGDFKGAMPIFKEGVKLLTDLMLDRDRSCSKHYAEAARQPDTAAVVGLWGTTHTRIQHLLTREGLNVRAWIPEKKEGGYVFPAAAGLARKMSFYPEKGVSELEWHQAMIAETWEEVVGVVIQQHADKNQTQSPPQEVIQVIHYATLGLSNMERVEEFRRVLEKQGLHAFQSLLYQATVRLQSRSEVTD